MLKYTGECSVCWGLVWDVEVLFDLDKKRNRLKFLVKQGMVKTSDERMDQGTGKGWAGKSTKG
jgi:hypothetical protein